jgi:hypothetical protein
MDRAVSDIQGACEELKPITLSKHLLVMNGGDHEKAEPRLAEILDEARKRQGIAFDTEALTRSARPWLRLRTRFRAMTAISFTADTRTWCTAFSQRALILSFVRQG